MGVKPLHIPNVIGAGAYTVSVLPSAFSVIIGGTKNLDIILPDDDVNLIGAGLGNIGDDYFTNGGFSGFTIGSEVMADPGFDNALDWSYSSGWTVSGGKATHTGGTSDNILTAANTTTIGESYVASVDTNSNTEDGSVRLSARWGHENVNCDVGLSTFYTAAVGSPTPQNPSLRSAGSLSGSWIVDSFSVKPISLNSFVEIGTRSVSEYLIFDAEGDTVSIVSGGSEIGISQDVGAYLSPLSLYGVSVDTYNSGTAILKTDGDGTIATINGSGLFVGMARLTDTNLKLVSSGSCDIAFNFIELFPVFS